MLTLFHAPGACSLGIVFLLEELGVDYRVETIDLKAGEQHSEAFLARNPKGKVPALLREDGSVLTEFQAIACWLVMTYGAWPDSIEEQVRTLEALEHIVGTIHMRGFTFVAVPQKFTADEAGQKDLRAFGMAEISKGLKLVAERIGEGPYVCGAFGAADAALFYCLVWANSVNMPLPPELAAYFDRVASRPSAAIAMGKAAA